MNLGRRSVLRSEHEMGVGAESVGTIVGGLLSLGLWKIVSFFSRFQRSWMDSGRTAGEEKEWIGQFDDWEAS